MTFTTLLAIHTAAVFALMTFAFLEGAIRKAGRKAR